jgi:hypothetical protein
LNGPLGNITRQFLLVKSQVARQLLNYKKEKFMNTQVSVLLKPSDLDERIREGMAMSAPKFVSSTRKVALDDDTFVSDDTPECQVLCETATDNVFGMADADDNNQ